MHGHESRFDDGPLGEADRRQNRLEKTNTSSTRSGPSSSSDNGGSAGSAAGPVIFAPSYLEIKGWSAFRDRDTYGLTEDKAKDLINKLRQGIGSDLDSLSWRAWEL